VCPTTTEAVEASRRPVCGALHADGVDREPLVERLDDAPRDHPARPEAERQIASAKGAAAAPPPAKQGGKT